MSVLRVENMSVAFGGIVAVKDVSLAVESGEIFAIIGPNGAGKTTLFNLITGVYRPLTGRIFIGDAEVTGEPPHLLARRGLSRTFQNLQVFFRMTAAENVMVGRHLHEAHRLLPQLFALPSAKAQNRATEASAQELLGLVGLAGQGERVAQSLPYGALKRLEIARALATEPKILLLDEPTAGCNAVETEEIDNVIQQIAARGVAVVLVEHDMRLVMKISNRIHVLEQGRTLAEGTAAAVRADPAVITAYLGGAAGGARAHG